MSRGSGRRLYFGGERAGGKPGRASENKVPILGAVLLNDKGRPLYVKVTQRAGFTNGAISKWAPSNFAPGTAVLSDGMACFGAVTDADCTHSVEIVGKRKSRHLSEFKWVNTVLGNFKTMLSGADRSFEYSKYADRYLGSFVYQFNRRFDLADLVVRLVVNVCGNKATALRRIWQAEVYF